MQPENHGADPSGSAPLPPSSPTLFHHHHHPQPTATPEPEHPTSLRRRHASTLAESENTLRISIATPYTESRKKECKLLPRDTTVSSLKDEVADGWDEDEKWGRDGMRLVWQGRIVRDEEKLGDIVGNTGDTTRIHTFHLVARRIGSRARSRPPAVDTSIPTSDQPTMPSTSTTTATSSSTSSHESQALNDTIHYLLFTARYHLCHLTGLRVIQWDQTVPAPTVDQGRATSAVISVVRVLAADRAEWAEWQNAFGGDSAEEIDRLVRLTPVGAAVDEIKAIWKERVGRDWQSGPGGERVAVELDGATYMLNLPPVEHLAPKPLIHLLLYLRITSLLPRLIDLLPSSAPPSTLATPPAGLLTPNSIHRLSIRFNIRIPHIPAAILVHIGFNILKVAGMIWMLTRDMKWDDVRLWVIVGGAVGWVVGDGMSRIMTERRAVAQLEQAQLQAQVQAQAQAEAVPPAADNAQAGAVQGNNANPDAARARLQAQIQQHRNTIRANRSLATQIPLLHLPTDTSQLRLPDPSGAPTPPRQPPRWQTQLLLPIALWVITLIPEWEAMRARAIRKRERAIRKRERAIRVVVGELSGTAEADARGGRTGEAEAGVERAVVLPEGLGVAGKRYYERVMARGDGIDWEEEREAQRALGVGEEEEAQGDGMRMRML